MEITLSKLAGGHSRFSGGGTAPLCPPLGYGPAVVSRSASGVMQKCHPCGLPASPSCTPLHHYYCPHHPCSHKSTPGLSTMGNPVLLKQVHGCGTPYQILFATRGFQTTKNSVLISRYWSFLSLYSNLTALRPQPTQAN